MERDKISLPVYKRSRLIREIVGGVWKRGRKNQDDHHDVK